MPQLTTGSECHQPVRSGGKDCWGTETCGALGSCPAFPSRDAGRSTSFASVRTVVVFQHKTAPILPGETRQSRRFNLASTPGPQHLDRHQLVSCPSSLPLSLSVSLGSSSCSVWARVRSSSPVAGFLHTRTAAGLPHPSAPTTESTAGGRGSLTLRLTSHKHLHRRRHSNPPVARSRRRIPHKHTAAGRRGRPVESHFRLVMAQSADV